MDGASRVCRAEVLRLFRGEERGGEVLSILQEAEPDPLDHFSQEGGVYTGRGSKLKQGQIFFKVRRGKFTFYRILFQRGE